MIVIIGEPTKERSLDFMVMDSELMPDLERTVVRYMKELEAPVHIKGYSYVCRAIMLYHAIEDHNRILTTIIYPQVAEEFGTTPACVERDIRHCITVVWREADWRILKNIFGKKYVKRRPTNAEFIAIINEKLKYELLF